MPRGVTVALISATLAACSIAALLGCHPKTVEEKSTTATGAAQLGPVPTGLEVEEGTSYALKLPSKFARWTGDWDTIKQRGVLRMLVLYSKTSFFYDKGRPRGLNAEMAQELELYLNKKLKTGAKKFEVALIPVTPAQLLQSLNDGVGDIIAAGIFVTPERGDLVDFTTPIITGSKLIVVTNKNAPPVAKLADLGGRDVLVSKVGLSYGLLQEINQKLTQSGQPKINIMESDPNLLEEDLLEMTNAGLIGATTAYDRRAELWSSVLPNLTLNSNAVLKENGDLAWAMRKNSPTLKALLDDFLKVHRQGTVFGRMMFAKYFKNAKVLKNSTSRQELQKFQMYVKYFQKYAEKYNFDYLMLAAQGYQESMLEQKLRSPRGAIGVMQVLPQYAAASPINIPSVNDPDNNIHAGAKMLAQITKTYFNDPAITPTNKALFAFAAYNAGPNRIVRLRKEAEKVGLDPNIWFGNVELVVAKDIGQETVRYVSSVYKYYVAYKMAVQQQQVREAAKRLPSG